MVDWGYLGRLDDLKNSMSNKKTNHNHKEDLGCIPGLLLKRYHKTSMVSLNSISPSMRFIINNRTMKQISRHPSTIKHRHSSQWQAYSQNLESGW